MNNKRIEKVNSAFIWEWESALILKNNILLIINYQLKLIPSNPRYINIYIYIHSLEISKNVSIEFIIYIHIFIQKKYVVVIELDWHGVFIIY